MQYWLPGSHKAMFAFTTQHVDIEFPERTSDCPEPKNFQKKFPQKNTSQYPWLGEEIRDDHALRIWRFRGESAGRGSLMREKFVSWDCRENEASRVWQTSLIVNYHGLFYCAAMQSRKRNIYKLNCLNRSTNVWQKFPRKPIFLAKPSRLRLPLTLADQLLQTSFFLSPFTKKKTQRMFL